MNICRRRRATREYNALTPLAAMSSRYAIELGPVAAELDPRDVARPQTGSGQGPNFAHMDTVVTLERDVPHAAALRGWTSREVGCRRHSFNLSPAALFTADVGDC